MYRYLVSTRLIGRHVPMITYSFLSPTRRCICTLSSARAGCKRETTSASMGTSRDEVDQNDSYEVNSDIARLRRIRVMYKRLGLDREDVPVWRGWLDAILSPFITKPAVREPSYMKMRCYAVGDVAKHLRQSPYGPCSPIPEPPKYFEPSACKAMHEEPRCIKESPPHALPCPVSDGVCNDPKVDKYMSQWQLKDVSKAPDGTEMMRYSSVGQCDFDKIRQDVFCQQAEGSCRKNEFDSTPEPTKCKPDLDKDLLLCSRRKSCGSSASTSGCPPPCCPPPRCPPPSCPPPRCPPPSCPPPRCPPSSCSPPICPPPSCPPPRCPTSSCSPPSCPPPSCPPPCGRPPNSGCARDCVPRSPRRRKSKSKPTFFTKFAELKRKSGWK